MFLGHYGLAFAAKRAAPRASLGTLVLAAQLADLAWPFLLLAGVERVETRPGTTPFLNLDFVSYPYSHSLLVQVLLGAALAIGVYTWRRRRVEACVVGLLVPSHWLLDWLVHVPDLPLYPGDPTRHGLGLWRSEPLTLALEFGMLAAGYAIYASTTRARDRVGRWASVAFVAFLVLVYAASLAADQWQPARVSTSTANSAP